MSLSLSSKLFERSVTIKIKKLFYVLIFLALGGSLTACSEKQAQNTLQKIDSPVFKNGVVHDPSVIKSNENYYIIGSHLQMAKSSNLMAWEQISESVPTTELFEDVYKEFAEEFEYAKSDTMWAGDITQLEDGRYYLYYCLCEGASPRSVLGVAVSDSIEGPYTKIESFLWSGGAKTPNGKPYNANTDPNVIDPHVFYDKDGQLWMVYGSYSGGIFILEMNNKTGLPKDRTTYGTKILGGNHARIEAPYILYVPETDYYYLFTSYGGLDLDGGYNIRVARSKTVNGPFKDMQGNDVIKAKGRPGVMFDDENIQDIGTKMIGNMIWDYGDSLLNRGYMSPGHNSAIIDEENNQTFLLFHTRFPGQGENYEVRTHQLLFNEEGWPMIVPRPYSGEKEEDFRTIDLSGKYMFVKFNNEISAEKIRSENLLIDNKKISGALSGRLDYPEKVDQDFSISLNDGSLIKGKFISVWDDYMKHQTIAFTGYSQDGDAVMLVEEKD